MLIFSNSLGRFINPTDYDDVNNRMYCSGGANTYIRWDNPQSGSTFTTITMAGLSGGTVSAVKVSSFTANTVYFDGGTRTPTLIKAVMVKKSLCILISFKEKAATRQQLLVEKTTTSG